MATQQQASIILAFSSMLTHDRWVCVRPTGLRIELNAAGSLIVAGGRSNGYPRLTIADILADDWSAEPAGYAAERAAQEKS